MSDYSQVQNCRSFVDFDILCDTDPFFLFSLPVELQLCPRYEAYQRLCCPNGKEPNMEPEPLPPRSSERTYPRIVAFDLLERENVRDDTFVWLNRESTPGQESHHGPKKKELEEAKQGLLGADAPFDYHQITASGILESASLGQWFVYPRYFGWLRDRIQEGLQNTPQGKTLYVVFHSVDRLIRPENYNFDKPWTWDLTEKDFEIFGDWLQRCFEERAKDVVFVTLHIGTPEEIRGHQSKLGMKQTGNMGGRPQTISKKNLKKEIHAEPPSHENNATSIIQRYEKKYGKLPVKKRTIQLWLKKADLSRKPGRPFGTKKKRQDESSDEK